MDPNIIEALVRAEAAEVEAVTPAVRDRSLAEFHAMAELDREIGAVVDEWEHRPWWEHLAAAEVLDRIRSALPTSDPTDEESAQRLFAALAGAPSGHTPPL